jgi:hypothetical protein
MAANGGSTGFRNLPDVALTADNVYVTYANGNSATFGGTSCAAPLWAGLMALVNQQAASYGLPSVGFVNPALYTLGKSASYPADFHDIATGNNIWPSSPSQFSAVNGYDLCTGWGTPAGPSLINALAPQPDALGISPAAGLNSSGPFGGAFSVNSFALILTNSGIASLDWSVGNTSVWLDISPSGGSILPGLASGSVTGNLSAAATNLPPGNYPALVWFTNLNTGVRQNRQFNLQVTEPLLIFPTNGFVAAGLVGGPFNRMSQVFSLTNAGGKSWSWSVGNTSLWLSVSPAGGTLAAGGQSSVTASLNPAASNLLGGTYSATVQFSNLLTGGVQSRTFTLQPSSSLVQNSGFETGDFTGWNRSGNAAFTSVTTSNSYVHSGADGLRIGPSGSLGFLAQTLPTVAGQTYFISFWFTVPAAGTPNEIKASWGGTVYFDQTNLPALSWTNVHFLAAAPTSSTVLKFGFQNNPAYFGFDDVNVTPVPKPFIRLLAQTNATPQMVWNTTPGLIYQVQYQTNLAQTGWLNLGASFTATNLACVISDPAATDAQRFYRIVVLP